MKRLNHPQYDDDEWMDEDDLKHARKGHQNHRGRNKGQVRRNIENYREDKQLRENLREGYDD
ncbi:PA3496 family putative envelope integrity protein [Celerinatantimonas sp. YJH-8]|uniref:PA3496 family putative envelope integrity protein n=1 Tax=Celerinatantimonas sp. YJH-8 TaxID=3228714 RepID=UPI0038BFB00C